MLFKTLSLILVSFLFSACSSSPKVTNEKMVSGLSVQNYKNKVYFSGQPSSSDFAEFAQKGIKTIINLREPSEMKALGFSEKEAAEKAGLTYYNIPVSRSKSFQKKAVTKIEETFMKHHKKEKVLLHCGSGTRAKAWFAIHVAETHKTDAEAGLKKARKLGLSNDKWEEKVKGYLNN